MRRVLSVSALAVILAGCSELSVPDSGTGGTAGGAPQRGGLFAALFSPSPGKKAGPNARPPLRETTLLRNAIVLTAPEGYCIDPTTRTDGFAMIASCRILTNGAEGRWVPPVLVTVTAVRAAAGDIVPTSTELAASLSQTPLAGTDETGLSLVHLPEGGDDVVPNGDPKHWRAAARINGGLLGFALYAPEDSRLAGSGGLPFLRRLIEQIARKSGAPDQAPQPGGKAGLAKPLGPRG